MYTSRAKDLGYGVAGKFVYLPFTAYNDWGARVSSGYYSESIATANVSYNFLSSYYFSGISVGANLKAAYRHVPAAIYSGQSALTGMMDFGVLSQFNFLKFYASRDRNLSLGATVRNFGLYAEGDPLPTYASFGFAYSPIRPLTLAMDFNYPFSLTPSTNPPDPWNIASGLKLAVTNFFTVAGGFRYQGGDPRLSLGSEVVLNKISIIMFSGTADKFIPLGVLAQAAAAMDMEVQVFVTGFALHAFTKEPHQLPFPAEFADMAPALAEGMAGSHVAPWDEMLRQAKALGAHVHACSMMSGVMGLAEGDFNDLVDDIVGAASFLQTAEGGETFFI